MSRLSEIFGLKGEFFLFQTDPETGLIIPNSELIVPNAIQDGLYASIFEEIKAGTASELYLNNLYDGATGTDGIVVKEFDDAGPSTNYALIQTSYNDGGDGTKLYVEYYGEKLYTSGIEIQEINLYKNVTITSGSVSSYDLHFSKATVSYNVSPNRRLHLYYKLSKA